MQLIFSGCRVSNALLFSVWRLAPASSASGFPPSYVDLLERRGQQHREVASFATSPFRGEDGFIFICSLCVDFDRSADQTFRTDQVVTLNTTTRLLDPKGLRVSTRANLRLFVGQPGEGLEECRDAMQIRIRMAGIQR